jgi:hypothetical protein
MTVGEIRFRLSKMVPGTDLELLSAWIQDRYNEILTMLPWQRVSVADSITTTAGTAGTADGCTITGPCPWPINGDSTWTTRLST